MQVDGQKQLWGSGGILSKKIFENLYTAMNILVRFEQFSGKFCLNFLPLILSASPATARRRPIPRDGFNSLLGLMHLTYIPVGC